MGVLTGGDTRVNIQFEESGSDSYRTLDSSREAFVPGANTTLDTREASNNGTRITLPASKIAVAIEAGTFDGSWALSGALTNPWLFEGLFGSPSTTDNSDGTFTHTYSMGDAASFQIFEGYEFSTTAESVLEGCVPARIAVNPSVGEDGVVPFTIEGFYAYESTETDVSLTSQDTLDNDPWDYADARLDLDGSEEAIVQDASVEMALNPLEAVQGFGSRFAIDFLAGQYEPTLNYSKMKQDTATQKEVYGGSTSMQEDVPDDRPLTLDLDNGAAAGSGANQLTFAGSGGFANTYSEDGSPGDPQTAIQDNVDWMLRDLTVEATNETATPP